MTSDRKLSESLTAFLMANRMATKATGKASSKNYKSESEKDDSENV